MIKTFKHKTLRRFYETGNTKGLSVQNTKRLRQILLALDGAVRASDMDLPGFFWHNLAPGQPSRYSVRVTGNWRVTYAFRNGHAEDVDLEDYH